MKPVNIVKLATVTLVFILVFEAAAQAPKNSARIAAVETNLRPAVAFQGDPAWTISERMEHYGVPGVQIAVIHDFRVVWFKSYGLADRETSELAQPTTLFQAGSISKPVAAFGAMLMVADGRLPLDRNVNEVLTSWTLPDNKFTVEQKVTLSHLLSHTGGLTVHGFPGYAVGDPVPTVVQVLDGEDPANTAAIRVDKLPGEGFRYSGGGYTIAQLMMVDATQTPFPELMHTLLLGPLGMRQSTYLQPLPPDLLRHAAAGVLPDKSAVEGKRHTYPEMAAAGLWTTAEDLAIFAAEMQQALKGQGKVMSKETAQKMVEDVGDGYGRGWGVYTRDDNDYFGHGGWDEGFCAQLTAHRHEGYGVAVMINSNHPDFLDEVVRSVAHTYGWGGYQIYKQLDIPAIALSEYTGRYRYNPEQACIISADGNRLFLQYVGGDSEEMLYVGNDRYVRRGRNAPITFTAENGQIELRFVLDEGEFQAHSRLADDEMLPRELLAAGRYDEALSAYRSILAENQEERAVSENYLNNQGYGLLGDEKFDHAIAVLRVAADLYPSSANVWDSLGEAYRKAGDLEKSIQSYRKALELEPELLSAKRALVELESAESK